MKKILIIPGNTDLNRGDQALVWESVHLAEDIYGKDNVLCMLMSDLDGPDAQMQNRQTAQLGFQFVNTLIKHPGRKFAKKMEDSKAYSKMTLVQWGLQAVRDYLHTRLLLFDLGIVRKIGEIWLSKKEKGTLNKLKECDAVFVKGGGFIHSYGGITDPYFIYYLTYHIRLAEAYGKDVFLLPNSIGPLKNRIAKRIALKALRRCSLLTVRENISKDFLMREGVDAKLYPDLGFFLKPSDTDMRAYLSSKGVPLNQKKVVVTLRPYRFQGYDNSDKLFTKYINAFVTFVKYLSEKGYHITFTAHTLGPSSHEDDRIAIKEVLGALPEDILKTTSYIEDFELTCKEIEKIYSYYDYMVGTRFHSVIFSLNVGVPSIAVAYGGNKGKGIMNVIGNGIYSIDMDKVDDKQLIRLFDTIESNREHYMTILSEKRKEMNVQRKELIETIRSING